jgi:hypothetical protein
VMITGSALGVVCALLCLRLARRRQVRRTLAMASTAAQPLPCHADSPG